MFVLYVVVLVVGFAVLIKGADVFVDGSAGLARRFHVPGLIIGLTVVSMGTSAPELAVSTVSAIQGSNEIAISNVVGSNIFNLLIVLGACAVIKPLPVDVSALKRDFPISIFSPMLVLFVAVGGNLLPARLRTLDVYENAGVVSRGLGSILLICFISYLMLLIGPHCQRKSGEAGGEEHDQTGSMTLGKSILLIVSGLVMIVFGGQAVVYSAREIALAAGLTETLVGLTIVAVGTSLPELVTSLVAAKKGETGLAVGNVLGSNIFNLLFILGVSAAIQPILVNTASVYDLVLLILLSVYTFILSISNRSIGRIEGLSMVICYICYMIYAIRR